MTELSQRIHILFTSVSCACSPTAAMALTLASQSSGVPLSPAKQLNEAVDDFQRILTEDQRTVLKKIKAIPDADAVLVFTAQLDSSQHRRGRSIATRLHSVLQSVRDFSAVIDTFVSSNPQIAALVWGSVKLTIQIALRFTSYYEAFSNLFMGFASHCPRFAEYQVLYANSVRLQTALCSFHASLIRCCKHAVEAAQRPCLSLRCCLCNSLPLLTDPRENTTLERSLAII
ncbi:hypothetical protein N657DRAFT_628783 [Parathielavia appendiculata]|uniref:DUF7708 domain-containing protein n=1 Tax=Parathielavia appendiculata TaxID=2587402 RepID=A0AAN6YZB0_9PEZI|nr:hypothetical protein N657DRAFT_628783 [Parathielavia appendiculata]